MVSYAVFWFLLAGGRPFAVWPPAVVISIAIAVLQYHLYDVRLVIRRAVVYGGLTVALPASSPQITAVLVVVAPLQYAYNFPTIDDQVESRFWHALHSGARGYLLKDAEPDAIIRAILAVNEGQAIFDPGIAARVIAATGTPEADRPFPVLTDREFEILDRLARGLRNDAISARMGISIKTVQNNVSTILLKLGAADRAQAVALARDAGMGRRP
jgi:DNA-binding CsgD family transcriptional regulator